jgi:hypothetical protein
MAKISILVMGILFLSMGFYRLFHRTHHDPSFNYPIDIGPHHWVIGVIFIVGGLYFVYNATKMIIRDKRKGRPPRESG